MSLPVDQLEDSDIEDTSAAPVRMEPETPDGRVATLAASERRSEAALWAASFVIVAACHGAGALALIWDFAETAESGINAPVVMLDLPESLVQSVAPVQDLPPGPVVADEVLPTPPPKDETKRPEIESDVALPKPDPPKPLPPVEVRQATAPPPARTPPKSVTRWWAELAAHIERFKQYPQTALARGETGTAKVLLTIDREGHLLRSSILQSSGSAALDQEALAVIARAQPLPRPPAELAGDELTFVRTWHFNLK
jgi:protein TonB